MSTPPTDEQLTAWERNARKTDLIQANRQNKKRAEKAETERDRYKKALDDIVDEYASGEFAGYIAGKALDQQEES